MKKNTNMSELIDYMMAYEDGELSENETIQFYQHLIDTGMCWKLQGHYERTGLALIQEGLCEPTTLPFSGDKLTSDGRIL